MDKQFNDALWNQFGASIDMLENAMLLCPDDKWDTEKKFWYNAYHCLFFLDYYLTPDPMMRPVGFHGQNNRTLHLLLANQTRYNCKKFIYSL